MALQFKPKSEHEIASANLAVEGIYNFEVLQASNEVSKRTGNPMIKVKLGVYDSDQVRWHVFDYLMPAMEAKLRHFCDATGLLSKYEAGTLSAEDCQGRSGQVKLTIEDKDPAYPAKNVVKDYVIRKAKPLGQKTEEPLDDVPF